MCYENDDLFSDELNEMEATWDRMDKLEEDLRMLEAERKNQLPKPNKAIESIKEIKRVNRSVIMVRPRQPFIDWLKKLSPKQDFELDYVWVRNVYLTIGKVFDYSYPELLAMYYELIFEKELLSVWEQKMDWPQKRDLDTLKKWFDIEFTTELFDLEKGNSDSDK